MYDKIKYMFI